jgi:hypothetical protein
MRRDRALGQPLLDDTRGPVRVHGARTVALRLATKTDPRSRWFQAVIDRRGFNKGIVAMANRTARIA